MVLFTKNDKTLNIATIYRYCSLFITSLFYILENDYHNIIKKLIIIACISITAFILNYLYSKNYSSNIYIKILVLIEVLGNSLILIPSGGLSSPYIWYSINTLLVSSIYLNFKYIWINSIIYFINIFYLPSIFIEEQFDLSFTSQEANLLLSYILIAVIIHVLSDYTKKIQNKSKIIEDTNNELILANNEVNKSISYILEIYKTVHNFSTQQDKDRLVQTIIEYSEKIIDTDNALFIYTDKLNNEKSLKEITKLIGFTSLNETRELISNNLHDLTVKPDPILIEFNSKKYVLSSVKNEYKVFGLLVLEIHTNKFKDKFLLKERLKFITDLSAIVIEKVELEQVNELFLVNEEQNRIANEIHDGVLQKLFSISCCLFSLSNNVNNNIDKNKIISELNLMRKNINESMKDLRSTIYGLSWKKYGDNSFINLIKTYIDDIKALNNIDIKFSYDELIDILSSTSKKALYRIICESIGNAVRHGNATEIEVFLIIESEMIKLEINDNGIGFNVENLINSNNKGLGLDNIQQLTYLLNGNIQIDSKLKKGTKINIILPIEEKRLNMGEN